MAAHQILQLERRQSMPHMCLETSEPEIPDSTTANDDEGDLLTMRTVEPAEDGNNGKSPPREASESMEQTEADAKELYSTEDTSL